MNQGFTTAKESTKTTKQLNCFIIMPFTKAEFLDSDENVHKLNEDELKDIYENLFLKAVKSYKNNEVSFINVHRNHTRRGNFVKDIVGKLQDYDLVIADLTGFNPNVFYELGIRHTLTNGTIMLSQDKRFLPSDLKSYIGTEYEYHKVTAEYNTYYPKFEKELHHLIDDFLEERTKVDNPVRDFIGDRIIFRKEERIKEIKSYIELMLILQIRYLMDMASYKKTFDKWRNGIEAPKPQESLSHIAEALLNKIVNSNGNIKSIIFIDNILRFLRVNEKNILFARKELKEKKELEAIRKTNLAFPDRFEKSHNMLDLIDFHNMVDGKYTNIYNEPIYQSFDYFINALKIELNQLTK